MRPTTRRVRMLPALVAAVGLTTVLTAAAAPATAAPRSTASASTTAPAATTPAATAAADGAGGTLLMVLDSSGSMAGPAAGGVRKIDAAKTALDTVVRTAPGTASLGMRVYGATSSSCTDTQLVVPPATADGAQRARLTAAVGRYRPRGNTPIGYSLQKAAEDLRTVGGRRTILLVSDGEETCHADPCRTAAAIAASGVDIKVDVVGLRVDAKTRAQLQCIASAGHGTYYDAAGVTDLTESLTVSTVKAVRPFRLTGKPVRGAVGSAELPDLAPGQYLDALPATTEKQRYRIPKTPGSTVRISTTLFLPPGPDTRTDAANVEVTAPDGSSCDTDSDSASSYAGRSGFAVATAVVGPKIFGYSPEGCLDASELVLTVQRGVGGSRVDTGATRTPMEILVSEQGAVTNAASLPAPAPQPRSATLAAAANPALVVGGTSFSDAPALPPAGGRDTIRPGETLVYKVPVRWGQQPSFRVDLAGSSVTEDQNPYGRNLTMDLYGPDRSAFNIYQAAYTATGSYSQALRYDGAPVTGSVTGPQVRYTNRTQYNLTGAAQQGWYYLVLNLAVANGSGTDDFGVPVTVRAAALGAPSGVPVFQALPARPATTDPTQPANPGAPSDPAGSPTPSAAGEPNDPTASPTPRAEPSTTAADTTPAPADTTDPAQAAGTDARPASDSGSTSTAVLAIWTIGALLTISLLVLAVRLLRRPGGQAR